MNLDYDTLYKGFTLVTLGWVIAKIVFGIEVEIKVMKATAGGTTELFKSQLENIVKALDEVKSELKELRK